VFTSPNKGTGDALGAVYAVSASDVWAAGSYYNGTAGRTLIEHFNGKSWSVVTSPNVGALSNEITALRGTSANDIWAVGDAVTSYPTTKTVILHWNGHRWRLVTSPSVPDKPNFLTAVRPVSASEAWPSGPTTARRRPGRSSSTGPKAAGGSSPAPMSGPPATGSAGCAQRRPPMPGRSVTTTTAPPTRSSSCAGTDTTGGHPPVPASARTAANSAPSEARRPRTPMRWVRPSAQPPRR